MKWYEKYPTYRALGGSMGRIIDIIDLQPYYDNVIKLPKHLRFLFEKRLDSVHPVRDIHETWLKQLPSVGQLTSKLYSVFYE